MLFFVYIPAGHPKGAGPWRSRTRELALVGRKRQGTYRARSDRWPAGFRTRKNHRDSPPTFLGTMRPDKRIRRSPPGDWNILRPATWKSSTYEIFVSAFFLPVNTAWTPNLFISFNFHYFHKWLVERSEGGFLTSVLRRFWLFPYRHISIFGSSA